MECNKEEAFRAKEVAEFKMQSQDFFTARTIALKAQRLFPELENIPQMLSVCDIHCAAETKVGGNEMDWYGILQVAVSADDATIKKQFRKLALSLHPDKNKSSGAEAAFKLIGEAQRVLLDSKLRLEHNVKRNSALKQTLPRQHWAPSRSSARHQQKTIDTFWTSCSFCHVRFQYHLSVMNKSLRCQHCLKAFVASEINAQGHPLNVTPGVQQNFFYVPPKTNAFNQNFQNGCQQGENVASFTNGGVKMNICTENSSQFSTPAKPGAEHASRTGNRAGGGAEKDGGTGNSQQTFKASKARNKKRGRREEMESSDSDDESSFDEDVRMGSGDFTSFENDAGRPLRPRRSAREKKRVAYNESESDEFNENDEDDDSNDEYIQSADKSRLGVDGVGPAVNGEKQEDSDAKGKSGSDSEEGGFTYQEPEFYDFDQDRTESAFKVDQVWALYDDRDSMPRFYARIRKVFQSPFHVDFTWLEHRAMNEFESNWNKSGLPIACGYFKLRGNESGESVSMFSYLVSPPKKNSTYKIYPKKAEIWAIFKDWDVNWIYDREKAQSFKFEVVELLSDFDDNCGAEVAYMVKLKGFVSLFQRRSSDSVLIPSTELLRFSHRIPALRLTGREGKSAPNGSVELDPAASPPDLEEF